MRNLFRLTAMQVSFAAILTATAPFLIGRADGSGNIHPTGCDNDGLSINWTPYCWTGVNYNRTGTYVAAVQMIEARVASLLGPVNCTFGVQTGVDTTGYQNLYNLSQDGIVGPQTWTHMNSWLTLNNVHPTTWGAWWFFSAPRLNLAFKYQQFIATPNQSSFFVLIDWPLNDGDPHPQYVQMNVNDIRPCKYVP